jgi:hypothetical protein
MCGSTTGNVGPHFLTWSMAQVNPPMKSRLAALFLAVVSIVAQGCSSSEPVVPAASAPAATPPGQPDTASGPAGVDPSQK